MSFTISLTDEEREKLIERSERSLLKTEQKRIAVLLLLDRREWKSVRSLALAASVSPSLANKTILDFQDHHLDSYLGPAAKKWPAISDDEVVQLHELLETQKLSDTVRRRTEVLLAIASAPQADFDTLSQLTGYARGAMEKLIHQVNKVGAVEAVSVQVGQALAEKRRSEGLSPQLALQVRNEMASGQIRPPPTLKEVAQELFDRGITDHLYTREAIRRLLKKAREETERSTTPESGRSL